jgi:peptide deformylase
VSLLDIRVLGDPILRKETTPLGAVTEEIRRLIDDMFETMYAAKGIGLAAPQVGRTERITVIDVDEQRLALINPRVVLHEGETRAEEGCLSIPDIYGEVDRAQRVVVEALDRDGKTITVEGTDLLARCLQHEIDHLDGKLFIDYLSVLKRRAALAKWATIKGRYKENIRRLSAEEIAAHHRTDEEL